MGLNGKVAIVTGASAGIGRAYALALAGAGATVVAAARTMGDAQKRNSLAEVVAASGNLTGTVTANVCDVSVEADVTRLVDETITTMGRIDVLVNNAGILSGSGPLDMRADEWDRVMQVNVRAAYLAVRDAAPHMIGRRSGSIVNVTARAGEFIPKGKGAQGSPAYAVSKAALNRLTFFMAEELRQYGIAVNALSPGVVLTDTALALNPRLGESRRAKPCTPEVLGPALLHLASQTAETMTGQVLHTDEFGQSWP